MIISNTKSELENRAAELVKEHAELVLQDKSSVTIGVVGGRSVGSILELLRKMNLDWTRYHFFMVDERMVPPNHNESNYRLVSSILNKNDSLPHVHQFPYREGDWGKSLKEYDRTLKEHGGKFDIILLSSGEDGHIASLFPVHETVKDTSDTFIVTTSAPKPPPERMTATVALISKAQAAILLFFGNEKQEAFLRLEDDGVGIVQCPAKIVKSIDCHYVLNDCGDA